mmetsp:Transcript_2134/g.5409  ORF Transcript_2134/g.5409 Transcript_2134/m.5409 type:complete len:251 (-) Transcript_2134:49-801(-)
MVAAPAPPPAAPRTGHTARHTRPAPPPATHRPRPRLHRCRAGVGRADLTVGLGHALNLVLLLDGVAVGGALGGVHQLISQALSNGLDVAEGGLARAGGQQPDGLVHAAQGGDINGLAAHHTGGADAGGILTWPAVDDGVNQHLNGVLVGDQVDDLERVLDDAHRHQLLAVVAAVHHQGGHQPLHNGALGLAEALLLVAPSGVGHIHRELGLHGDVVLQGDVIHLHIVKAVPPEQLDVLLRLSRNSHLDRL